MNVLVVSLNRERVPDVVAPIGCAYLMETLLAGGHEVDFIDLLWPDDPLNALAEKIRTSCSELILLSVRNLDCSVEPQRRNAFPWIREVVQIAQGSGIPVLIGGSGFSLLPERFLSELNLDYGLSGPCEQSLPIFLQHFHQKTLWRQIPGLIWRNDQGVIQVNPSQPWGIPAKSPMRGWRHIDVKKYYQEGGTINLQTKRGCVFRCTFCTYPQLEGNIVLQRDPLGVIEEISWWIEEFGIKHFFFVDSVFNSPKEHVESVLREIVARGMKISWTAYINPLGFTRELMDLMLESGCIGIEMGIDSGSDAILRRLKKGFLAKHVRRALKNCESAGLKSCVNLIFASPGENLQTVNETIDLLSEFPTVPTISMMGVRIYPGTPVFETALQEGLLLRDADLLQPTFYYSADFDETCMDLVLAQARGRQNWIIPDAGINTNFDMFQQLRTRQVKGPLWRVLRAGSFLSPNP